MMNQVVMVGRIANEFEVTIDENEKKSAILTLAISRPFKNMNGEYETDFIDCKIWEGIAENVKEYCSKGDLVGIRGRLQTVTVNDNKQIVVIADKVTFLSSKKAQEGDTPSA